MKVPGTVYLVGGAVRDMLLGQDVGERDWVVVGASEAEMREAGFLRIGKHFPVFLHPHTQEEYALARIDTKSGPGHQGFRVAVGPAISIEEDLKRRDLTINAMAKSSEGHLIDPYGGRRDIQRKQLRHVSDAFCEDPLRCFRVARFAASYPEFKLASATVEMMRNMQKELEELPAERVWLEYRKAMQQPEPARFFQVLCETDLFQPWFTGIDVAELSSRLRGLPRARRSEYNVSWWLPPDSVRDLYLRLKAPSDCLNMAVLVSRFGRSFAAYQTLSAEALLTALTASGGFQSGSRFEKLLLVIEHMSQVNLDPLRGIVKELKSIRLNAPQGRAYGERLRQRRTEAIRLLLGPEA